MAPSVLKKREHEASNTPRSQRPHKKVKKQTDYHSSSSDPEASDFPTIDLADSASESDIELPADEVLLDNEQADAAFPSANSPASNSDSEASSASGSSFSQLDPQSSTRTKTTSKRNDPLAFSTAITSILSSKLPTTKRCDPVLARSSTALAANNELREAHVEKLARQSIRAEKKALAEKGRVKDVLLVTVNTGKADGVVGLGTGVGVGEADGEDGVGKLMEQERRLKKTAQKGVVKLFNAVRMAQVRGEEARKEAVNKGVVGAKRREERVGEMSKKGFLELVASGGGASKAKAAKMTEGVEEA
ncbi:MAG: hypothetical protein Q9166_005982 [cf. Caloplaca sp. 2 TL-2023]